MICIGTKLQRTRYIYTIYIFRIFSRPTINEYKVCDIDMITPRGLLSTDLTQDKKNIRYSACVYKAKKKLKV